jgi:hypothetical protein
MKKVLCITIFLLLLGPESAFALSPSSGFVPGQIWYSKDELVDGDTVKIHTAIWNGESNSLSAKVEFYDKNTILGSRDVIVPGASLADVSISWKVTDGDHVISAKITSSSITAGGKKETVALSNQTTPGDHKFVAPLIKKQDGTLATSGDIIKSELGKIGSEINSVLPESLSAGVASKASVVDEFRNDVVVKVDTSKKQTQKEIDSFSTTTKSTKDSSSGIDKPIKYVKLYLLSLAYFIFHHAVVFYGIIVLVILYILRLIYLKIRHR